MTNDSVVYSSRSRAERIAQRERRKRYRIEIYKVASLYSPLWKTWDIAENGIPREWRVQAYTRFKLSARIIAWSYSDLGRTRVIDQRKEGL